MSARKASKTAAFFRVEGTLVRSGALSASAYLAVNDAGFRRRALRLGQLIVTTPLTGVLRQSDRTLANRAVYLALRGMSEDRIAVLGQEYFETTLVKEIMPRGRETLEKAQKQGHEIVLLSEAIDPVISPLIDEVGPVAHLVCNHLEYRDGEATGKLLDPIVGGHDGGRIISEYASNHNIDLAGSIAYAANGADLLFLAAVGQPCAVNPDFALRRAARDARWPILEYAG